MPAKLTAGKKITRETETYIAELGAFLVVDIESKHLEIRGKGLRQRRTLTWEDVWRLSRPVTWVKRGGGR